MQGKGVIRFFLIAATIVCVIQYLYILPTNRVENDAHEYALTFGDPEGEQMARDTYQVEYAHYLDSISGEKIWGIPLLGDFTYEELKQKQLALGLDLKGGMSVILQVDLRDLVKKLAGDSPNPEFNSALDKAFKKMADAQSDYITLFAESYRQESGGKKLARLFATNPTLRDEINFETSDGEVVRILREKANETVDLTFKRLKERIDELGVVQPNVSLDASRDLIIVELPGISNPERARNFLQSAAQLEFWNVYRISDASIPQALQAADAKLAKRMSMTPDSTWEMKYDSLGNITDSVKVASASGQIGPILSRLSMNTGQLPFSVIGTAPRSEMNNVMRFLNDPAVKSEFPRDIKWMWSRKPRQDYDTKEVLDEFSLYAIKMERGSEKAPLEGDQVTGAFPQTDPQNGQVSVVLNMNSQGAKRWAEMTTKAATDNNREIAIVLDNEVEAAPAVQSAITNGTSSITGGYSLQEADDLSKILQIGKLPAQTRIIQENIVGPSLGKENIASSVNSLLIGFGLVMLFMILYYSSAGIVSVIALLLNIFFIFGAMASLGTVLTLPGIAGIVLTIGMAVDANVIIYERVREELRAGKTLLASIKDGFQHSYSAIIDANVTTVLTAGVLAYFGLGPIKGFAVVLIIGVFCSIFTAVLVGRLIIDWWTERGGNLNFWSGPSKNAFANLNFDWLGKRKIAFTVSGLIIAAGIISMVVRGFDLGVDFRGGYSYNIQFEQSQTVDANSLRTQLGEVFGSTPVVKEVSTSNTYNVVTDYLIDSQDENAADQVMQKLFEGVNAISGGNMAYESFRNPNGIGTHVASSSKVGPTIADDIKKSALWATVFALLLIFLYIFIRFNKWQYGLGAVAALFHDTAVVLGIFSLLWGILPFSMEVDQAFIAAILTVIGYSINDTVVVFDRVREYFNTFTGKPKEELINSAINSTFSRTVITSVTTLLVVAILLFFGGSSIKGFAFAIFIGIIVGTYSSVFVATPIMASLTKDVEVKPGKEKSKRFSKAIS